MSTLISVLLPNTQFIYGGTANSTLSYLSNDSFTVEGTPKVWLCDVNNKGSLHTLDYSGNPSEIVVIPNSAPDTTNNTQWFMYYKNVGGDWIPSDAFITLPWVTHPTRAISGAFYNPVSMDGQFLWTNHTTAAPPHTTIAPNPLTINTSIPVINRLHWSSTCCAFDNTTTRANAVFSCGASLISPSYVVMANHCKPTRIWFQQEDGTEIYRDRVSFTQVYGDLAIAKLNAPIHTITPMVVADNPGVFGAQRMGYIPEIGGRITTMLTQYAPALSNNTFYLNRLFYTSNTGIPIQTGNSGHPFVICVAGQPFCLGLIHEGQTTVGTPYSTQITTISNIAKYLSNINTILAADNERVNTATVTITP